MTTSMIQSNYFSVEKLGEGVFAAIARKGEGAMSNAAFIDLGEEVLIFDTFTTPTAAKDLRRIAEEIIQKPIKYVVNSHYHGDHTLGNQVFIDAAIIATETTRQLHKERNAMKKLPIEKNEMEAYLNNLEKRIENEQNEIFQTGLRHQLNEMKHVYHSLDELQIVLPNLTFQDKLVFHGTDRSAELICFGGGHTPSDSFLFLPEDHLVFSGDLVLENMHPPIYHCGSFIQNLEKMKQFDFDLIVPGHGNLLKKDHIDIMLQYLKDLMKFATQSFNKGETLDQLLTIEVPEEYQRWTGMDYFKRGLSLAYQELSK